MSKKKLKTKVVTPEIAFLLEQFQEFYEQEGFDISGIDQSEEEPATSLDFEVLKILGKLQIAVEMIKVIQKKVDEL